MKLIASGCSFTDANYNNTTWKKWPDLIEGNWDEVINIACSGANNQYLLNDLIKTIYLEKDIDTIVIGLTNWLRYQVPDDSRSVNFRMVQEAPHKINDWKTIEIEKLYPTTFDVAEKRMDFCLMQLLTIANMCIEKNIKLHAFQMIAMSHNGWPEKYLLKSPYFSMLDQLHEDNKIDLMNWPWNIKGCVDYELGPKESIFRIGTWDLHPSALGQQFIADWFMENHKDI